MAEPHCQSVLTPNAPIASLSSARKGGPTSYSQVQVKFRESKSDPRLNPKPSPTSSLKPQSGTTKKLNHIYSSSHLFGGSSGTTTQITPTPILYAHLKRTEHSHSKMTLQTTPSFQSLHSVKSPKEPQPQKSGSTLLHPYVPLKKPSSFHSKIKAPQKKKAQIQEEHEDPLFISKLLASASRKAQGQQNLRVHKELLDKHVCQLIDVIQAQAQQIKALKLNQKPRIIAGKSLIHKLDKAHSTVDLLMPFRSTLPSTQQGYPRIDKGECSSDLKRFFLNHHPCVEGHNFDNVNESVILKTHSQSQTLLDRIDQENKSVLKDNEDGGMSQSGIECDLIRLNRIEQERRRKQQVKQERLFTESLQQLPKTQQDVQPLQLLRQKICEGSAGVGMGANVRQLSRQQSLQAPVGSRSLVTDEYVKLLMKSGTQNKLRENHKETTSVKSDNTERLSYTMVEDHHHTKDDEVIHIQLKNGGDQEESGQMVASPPTMPLSQLPMLKQMRHISQLNAQKSPQKTLQPVCQSNKGFYCCGRCACC